MNHAVDWTKAFADLVHCCAELRRVSDVRGQDQHFRSESFQREYAFDLAARGIRLGMSRKPLIPLGAGRQRCASNQCQTRARFLREIM